MKISATQFVSLTLSLLLLGSLSAQVQHSPPDNAKQDPAKKAVASAQSQPSAASDTGERKFQENCSRCHTAPEQLSPRIVGTVVRHMRVRASLSAEDEREILRFLAP
jgi:mono/diheme cytochrome c family protein